MNAAESDELANALIRDGAAIVIKSMLCTAATNDAKAEDGVASTMRSLEKMAKHRVDAACCLMLSLWPFASELMMHDVCDGIFLWIDNNRSAAVIGHLKHLVASGVDFKVKCHFEGLLIHIEQKA